MHRIWSVVDNWGSIVRGRPCACGRQRESFSPYLWCLGIIRFIDVNYTLILPIASIASFFELSRTSV